MRHGNTGISELVLEQINPFQQSLVAICRVRDASPSPWEGRRITRGAGRRSTRGKWISKTPPQPLSASVESLLDHPLFEGKRRRQGAFSFFRYWRFP